MDELIRINFDSDRPTVSGRELHAALEVKTAYKDWFPRMCDYGFEEGTDFCSFLSESTGGRPATDHQLTIAMAKELCMIQRSEAGRKFRQYFIKVEKAWNSPEAVMARALQFANNQLSLVKKQNLELLETVAVQNQQIAEMQPKASYYDLILQNKNTVPITQIAMREFHLTSMHSTPMVIRVLLVVLATFRRLETENPLVVAALQLMISAQRKMTISYLNLNQPFNFRQAV